MADLVLLLGNPVSRSLSPLMQNAAFAALGIDCRYEVREVDRSGLADAVAELRANERILGANVTIPHKEAVIPLLDDLDLQAARIGAVNTISRHGSRLKGSNTDVVGFQRALEERYRENYLAGYCEGKICRTGNGSEWREMVGATLERSIYIFIVATTVEQDQDFEFLFHS